MKFFSCSRTSVLLWISSADAFGEPITEAAESAEAPAQPPHNAAIARNVRIVGS